LAQAIADEDCRYSQNGDQKEKRWDDYVNKWNRIRMIIPELGVAESAKEEEFENNHSSQQCQ
jgi:hypothetical protein